MQLQMNQIDEYFESSYQKNKVFELIETYQLQIDFIEDTEQNISDTSVLETSKEDIEEIAKKFPFEASLISKYAILTTILGLKYDSCQSCDVNQYLAYFIPFFVFLLAPFLFHLYSSKKDYKSMYKILPNTLLLFALMLNASDRPFSCLFGLRISQFFGFIVIAAVCCWFKITSTLSKKKVIQGLLNKAEDKDALCKADYVELMEYAKQKIEEKRTMVDRICDFIEEIPKRYPMEMSVFVIYCSTITVMNFGYIGCEDCDIGEQFLRWLAFSLFFVCPILLQFIFNGYKSWFHGIKCIIFLFALLLLSDTKPFTCYIEELPFKITSYVLLTIVGVIDIITAKAIVPQQSQQALDQIEH